MVVAAIAVVVAGALFVMSMKGEGPLSSASPSQTLSAVQKKGNVAVVRAGIGYTLDEGSPLKDGDEIETLNASTVTCAADASGLVALNQNTTVRIDSARAEAPSYEVTEGSVFVDAKAEGDDSVTVQVSDESVSSRDAVFVASSHPGSASVQVLGGEVMLSDGTTLSAGHMLVISSREGESAQRQTSDLSLASLDAFALEHARSVIAAGRTLSFAESDIDAVEAQRAEEKAAAESSSAEGAYLATENAAQSGGSNGVSSEGPSPEDGGAPVAPAPSAKTCTIEIRCDTILDNMGDLASGKDVYVPANGVILATSTVEFAEGDTVVDVLRAVCSAANIQLEYSFTPVYNSYYIEGINNLYEFDCGNQSGWMFKVNGWFPNYGSSSYVVQDGDVIVWCYTCKGFGADLGASVR